MTGLTLVAAGVALGVLAELVSRALGLGRVAERLADRGEASSTPPWLILLRALIMAAVVAGLTVVFLNHHSRGEIARNGGIVVVPTFREGGDERRQPGPENSCLETRDRQVQWEGEARNLFVGNNPWPAGGQPHGIGISHRDYPYGYKLNGRPRPSFDNYIDYSNEAPNDERPFLGARILGPKPCPPNSFETRRKILVFPGDTVRLSVFIHNNGPTSHNDGGWGRAVARDTRVGIELPREPAPELQVSAGLFARNAVVLESDPRLHTISDNISIRSVTDSRSNSAMCLARRGS